MMCFKAVASTKVYFNESSPNVDPEPKGVGDNKIAYYDRVEKPLTGELEATDFMILNSDCGWSPRGMEDTSKL